LDRITKQMVKRLQAEIDKATDPQTVITLTRLMDQVLARDDKRKSKSKPVEKRAEGPTKKKPSLREIYTGSVFETISNRDLVIHHLVVQVENKRRELGRELTETEKQEITKSLSAEEYEEFEQA
jgi:hypothetical protein